MTNGSDRLDRIENDLEKRMQATDERIDRLTQNQDRTQHQLDQLSEDVNIAFWTITALSGAHPT